MKGGACLLNIVRRNAENHLFSDALAHLLCIHVVLTDVDTVCLTAQGKFHIVVDDEGDPTGAAELADEPGLCKKIRFIQLLFAQLHAADTAVDGSADWSYRLTCGLVHLRSVTAYSSREFLSNFIISTSLQLFGSHTKDGINQISSKAGIAVAGLHSFKGKLPAQSHGADGSSRGIQRESGLAAKKAAVRADSWQPAPVMRLIIRCPL